MLISNNVLKLVVEFAKVATSWSAKLAYFSTKHFSTKEENWIFSQKFVPVRQQAFYKSLQANSFSSATFNKIDQSEKFTNMSSKKRPLLF